MPLEILAPMVVLGIAFAVILVRFSGLSHRASLANKSQVREILTIDYPEESIHEIHLQKDGRTALATFESGKVGTINVMGAKFLTRKFSKGDVVSVTRTGNEGITARFNDFTHPREEFIGSDKNELDRLETIFENLI